jgi:hypothetical protein
MTGSDTIETKRGRVREALVAGLGFRFPKGVKPEDAKRKLDRICDDLVYLSSENLRRVIGALRTKGEGTAKCFWPDRATFLAFAEIAQPRALEDTPGVASWFASAAGREALAEDRLVSEFLFWERMKRPPQSKGDNLRVTEDAREMAARLRRARADREAGRAPFMDDAEWLTWYEGLEARARALVEAGKRGAAA